MDSGQKIVGLREQWAGIGLIIGEWNGLNNHLASAGTRAHFLSRFDHHMDQDDQWQWENQELPCVSHFLGLFQSPYVHMFLLLPAFHLLTLFFFPPPHLASHPPVLCSPKFSILHFATNFFSLNSLLPFFNDYYIILGQKINPFKKKFTHKKMLGKQKEFQSSNKNGTSLRKMIYMRDWKGLVYVYQPQRRKYREEN